MDIEDALPGIGHNAPPAPLTPVEITRLLADTERSLLARRDELLAGVARFKAQYPVIESEEVQSAAGDFCKQIAAAIKKASDTFTLAKRPWLDGGRAVDAFFKTISEPLTRGLNEVRQPMTAYAVTIEHEARRKREAEARAAQQAAHDLQQRLAAEQRAQDEAEAARRPAVPVTIEEAIAGAQAADKAQVRAGVKSAELSRTRGDLGSVSSLREIWDVEVEDLSMVPLEYLAFDYDRARKAVRNHGVRDIQGCRVFVEKHIQTR